MISDPAAHFRFVMFIIKNPGGMSKEAGFRGRKQERHRSFLIREKREEMRRNIIKSGKRGGDFAEKSILTILCRRDLTLEIFHDKVQMPVEM